MPSSAMRLNLESMAVLLNESHREALAEAGIENMMGADVTLEQCGNQPYKVT